MAPIMKKALNAYGQAGLEVSVETASPHRLIVMLYDGAIKATSLAKIHMQNGAIAEKGAAISKAIAIIEEGLRLSLDKEKGGELAENLDALYDYMATQLLDANLYNKTGPLDEVLKLLMDIREAWLSIDPAMQPSVQSSAPEQNSNKPLSYGRV